MLFLTKSVKFFTSPLDLRGDGVGNSVQKRQSERSDARGVRRETSERLSVVLRQFRAAWGGEVAGPGAAPEGVGLGGGFGRDVAAGNEGHAILRQRRRLALVDVQR